VRLAKLVANAPDRGESLQLEERAAYRFIDEVNKSLAPIDHNERWPASKIMRDDRYCDRLIRELLKTLTSDACGLGRV
jgi:CHASE3 domain sensor protein